MFSALINDSSQIVLSGRFDASKVDEAKKVFDEIHETYEVDFSGLEYIASAGIGVLLMTQKRLSEKANGLRLINVNKHIQDVFHYAGLDQVFAIS